MVLLTLPSRCSTCHLNTYNCPGHIGHIELPVPIYHVTFMSQLHLLLRAKCVYCSHLKLHPSEVNRFVCKLRLAECGLVEEVEELESIHLQGKSQKRHDLNGSTSDGEEEIEESVSEDEEILTRRREAFVKRAIKKHGGRRHLSSLAEEKVEYISEVRRKVIKEFFVASTKVKTCGTCKG